MPPWIDKLLYNNRYAKDENKKSETAQYALFVPVFMIMLSPIFALYPLAWVLAGDSLLTTWQYYEQSTFMWGAAFALWCFVMFTSLRVVRKINSHNMYHVVEEEKKQAIRQSHNVKGFATNREVWDAINREKTITGINVTGGAFNSLWGAKGHILTCGYARSGKGSRIIMHTLLNKYIAVPEAASFVILDPKGENLAIAGNYLQQSGYDVVVINPFDIDQISQFGKDSFNPFDLFDANSSQFNKYVDMIKDAINPPQSQKHANSFFTEAASDLIALYISHMMTQDVEPKNIKTLYRWLRLGGVDRITLLKSMSENPHFDIASDSKSIAQQLLEGGKSITDVYANAAAATSSFKDEGIRESMSRSTFSISDIANYKTALFICMTPDDMSRMAAWLRLLMASIMRGLTHHYNPNRKVVMLMDEFVTMGYLKEFQEGMGFIAGYNVTLWPIIQDLHQIKNLYPAVWETFVGNAAIKHWMVRDGFTADYLSKQMPNDLVFLGNNADGSPKYKEKPLMTPAEILVCEDIILQVDGLGKPALLKKVPYWQGGNDFTMKGSPSPFY